MRKIIQVKELLASNEFNVKLDRYNILKYSKGRQLSIDTEEDFLYIIYDPKTYKIDKLKLWEPSLTLQGTLNLCFRRKVSYSISECSSDGAPVTFMGPIIVISGNVSVEQLRIALLKRVPYPALLDYLKPFGDMSVYQWERGDQCK